MKRIVIFILLTASCFLLPAQDNLDFGRAYSEADKYLNRMTIEEKASMARGVDKFFIRGCEEKGIRRIYMSDASMGVNLRNNHPSREILRQLDSSTSFPATILLASTFAPELSYEYAKAIGEECRAGGIDILLGPGLNIYRQSQCSRNFEYFGEDPYVVSQMVENYVKGLQSTGTAACIKHFYGNNTEFYRKRSNSIIGERALHEIYLPGFQAGISAGALCVMTSYNLIDGEWAGQSKKVITDLLRGELGFKGIVMTDWNSVWDLEKVVKSGQNLEMPGTYKFGVDIMDLYREGKITEKEIDDMIRPLIAAPIAMGFYERELQDTSYLTKYSEHAELARKVASEGIVLLKNRNNILPLDPGVNRKILLTGRFVDEIPCGYGAAEVSGFGNVSLREALESRYGKTVYYIEKPTVAELQEADVVILSMGTRDRESVERPFALPKEDESFMRYVSENNPNTIAVINAGSAIDMSAWNDNLAALIYGWYGGQAGFDALGDIMTGKVSPSGKLPISIEKSFKESPAYGYLPKGAQFYKELRNEHLINVYDVDYNEGVLVGYRWYDTMEIEPLYPFGYGLSYTTFEIGKIKLPSRLVSPDKEIKCSVTVKNAGDVLGAEVVQLYVKENNPEVVRPSKELKRFKKVYLKPGESKVVEFSLGYDDLAYWNENTHNWETPEGKYTLMVGNSSRNIISSAVITVETATKISHKIYDDKI